MATDPSPPRFHAALLDTPFGWAGLVWSERGVRRLFLPQPGRSGLEQRLEAAVREAGGAGPAGLPPPLSALLARMEAYFGGAPEAFADVRVDLSGVDPFRMAVYAATRMLGVGETATYGELAVAAGRPGLAREVGQALGSNPVPLIVPCHRIVAAGNRIGGFSAPGGAASKLRMLALEGVSVGPAPSAQTAFAF